MGAPLRKVRGQLDEHSIGDDQSDIAKVFTTALSLSLSPFVTLTQRFLPNGSQLTYSRTR